MTDQLSATLEELATASGDVSVRSRGATTDYARGSRPFAVRDGDAIDLRLMAEIAEAARRTPDTHASSRGDDWVRFSPKDWDDHARDRLEAWFRVAWRFAEER